MDAAPELPPLYYLDNFEVLCEVVRDQYLDLLGPEEAAFYDTWSGLSRPARGLYVRLVSRVGPLFRSEQLHYPELGPLDDLIDELWRAGLLSIEDSPPLEAVIALCRKAELAELFAAEVGAAALRKADMAEQLRGDPALAGCCAARWAAWYEHRLLRPLHAATVQLLQLLFFGNRRQSLTEFVLSDLGVAHYFPYPLDRAFRLFEDRDSVDDYLALGVLSDTYQECLEREEPESVLALVPYLLEAGEQPPRWGERRDRLRNRVARQCERWQAWGEALALYAVSQRPPARERRARILQRLERYDEALALCREIERQPWCEEEQDFVARQIPLLRRKLGERVAARPREQFASEHCRLSRSELPVELASVQHYAGQWRHVHYVESGLVNGLFGLALWEQLFQPLPGAFVNPFQAAPLDMYSPEFYRRRRKQLDDRLASVTAGDLLDSFDRYQGYSCHWVNWRLLERPLVELAIAHVPLQDLKALWRRILFDPQANRSGLPDLVAFDEQRGYRFIEVKGPGDQLQANQKRWLRFFEQQAIPYSVAWVEWSDD